ncbi:MAG: YbjN domain-containing protein [Proteobacteria bacterium]|nr:YbjN domain-containing protein [Pseudomonadota bacterium]
MTLATPEEAALDGHPLDILEQAVEENGWPFERTGRDEINLSVVGRWCDYHFCFTWRDDLQSLHVLVNFDMRVARERRLEVAELLMAINARVWLGHFDLWAEDGAVVFRHVLIFPNSHVSAAQCEALMHLAVEACEHYYPVFQFVLWGGKSVEEAMAAAVLEVAGRA